MAPLRFFAYLTSAFSLVTTNQAVPQKKQISKGQNKENTETLFDVFSNFNEAKQSFYLDEDCQNDALDW